ncbi:MAG: trypsin-like peptidase domain-containing protein [Planctomycetota bacterium]
MLLLVVHHSSLILHPSSFITHRSSLLAVIWLLAAFLRADDDLKVLNEIQARHQRVYEQVAPAVVAVQTRGAKSGASCYGAGVVVSPDGLILTSSTVVPDDMRLVEVFFQNGRVMEAKVIGADDGTEACVLKVMFSSEDCRPLPYIELCDSSKVSVGELAYTAGNPFHTISRDGQVAWSVGTISGIYKIVSADKRSRYGGMVIETDAAVNPGSDGGPLIDSHGRLLGLLSLCFCESRWLGTAIPTHLIKQGLAAPLRNLPLFDPRLPAAVAVAASNAACAIPDSMRLACQSATQAMVKLRVKRDEQRNTSADHHGLPVNRLRQRPNAPVSGIIFDSEGYILTSAFNVEGDAQNIEAQLQNGSTLPAKLLGRHFGLDIAVLKVNPPQGQRLPALALSADSDLKIGRFVAVLGSSEDGAEPTRTLGLVSALGRLDGAAVQTDALINYGNSGGPVIDLRGRLIGLAAHVATRTEWSQQNSGVGFFTQSEKIIACLNDLKAARDLKASSRSCLSINSAEPVDAHGVKLEKVLDGSVAAAAKLQPGDIILAVDGMDTFSWSALVAVLKAHKPGDTIEIAFQRGATTGRVKTTLTARK